MTYQVRIKCTTKMSNSGFHRNGGKRSGAAHWWLLNKDTGTFADLPRVRGDDYFEEQVELDPGTYVLGVGRGRDAIRCKFVLNEDGTVDDKDSCLEITVHRKEV